LKEAIQNVLRVAHIQTATQYV